MQDLQKEKYLQLMTEIEELEELVEANPSDNRLKEKLASARNELARICDGCGSFHSKNL